MREKTLSERKDFYSMRRCAIQETMQWINEGFDKKEILKKLSIKYGFSERFYNNVLELMD